MSEYIVEINGQMPDAIYERELTEIVRCDSCKYYDECWTSEVYTDRHWCDRLTVYMPPNGFCSFGERRWLVCKCGEEIESTGGGFVICPICGAKVSAGD